MKKKQPPEAFLVSPLFEGDMIVDPFMLYRYMINSGIDDTMPDGSIKLSIPKGSKIYDVIKASPLKLQGMPFELVIPDDHDGDTHQFIKVKQLAEFMDHADGISVGNVVVVYLDNLQYIKALQEWKWYWGEPK